MITTDQIAIMASDVEQLRHLLIQVGDAQPLIDVSGGSASSAATGFMATMQTAIAQLDADRTLVFSGLRDYATWKSTAETYKKTMASVIGDAANYSFANAAKDVGSATVGEVAQDAADIGAAAKSGTTWGIAAAVLVLFVVWRLS